MSTQPDQVVGRLGSKSCETVERKVQNQTLPLMLTAVIMLLSLMQTKVKFTGNKWNDKVYLRYTGYPGGQREMTPAQLMKKPNGEEKTVEESSKGYAS